MSAHAGGITVSPVPESSLDAVAAPPGSLLTAIADDPDALVYFLLNVGDGDTRLLVLPPNSNDRVRRLVIVDVATPGKLPALLDAPHAAGLIEAPGAAGQIQPLVATHPHFAHIGGMTDLLKRHNGPSGCVDQFWEPGYFFPTPSFHNLLTALESSPWIRRLQPTAGTRLTLDWVRLTVLGPGVGLRNKFDTYGVEINDSSITLMVDYPAARLFAQPSVEPRMNRRASSQPSRRLLLGADAQFRSWAQTTVDFPDPRQSQNAALAKELRGAHGRDDLSNYVTGSDLDIGGPAGSIAAVISRTPGRAIRLFRLGDAPRSPIDLAAAREVLRPRPGRAKPAPAKPAKAKPAKAKPAKAKPAKAAPAKP